MDDLVSIVIFLVILAVAAIGRKVQEQRKEEEQRQNPPEPFGAEDLPEAARRTIYGTPGAPVARPARARRMVEEDSEGVRDEETEGEKGVSPVPRPKQKEVLVLLQELLNPERQTAPPPLPPRPRERPAPPAAPHVGPRPVAQPRPVAARPVAAQSRSVAARHVEPREGPAVRSPRSQPRRPEPQRASIPMVRRLLHNQDDVRRGIVLSEILGPPKGMQ